MQETQVPGQPALAVALLHPPEVDIRAVRATVKPAGVVEALVVAVEVADLIVEDEVVDAVDSTDPAIHLLPTSQLQLPPAASLECNSMKPSSFL